MDIMREKSVDHYVIAENIAKLLDGQFTAFGFRFGLDPIIGLLPGAGDIVTTAFSLYLVWVGLQTGLPSHQIGRMILNIAIDFAVGFIPIIGDIFDFAYKANSKNFEILKQHRVTLYDKK